MGRPLRPTRMKVMATLAVLLVVGGLLVGCGSPARSGGNAAPKATNDDVDGHTYIVTGITQGGEPRELVEGTEARLAFDIDSVTLTAGCNSMSGLYTLRGTRLVVRDLAGTEMGCDQARADQDAWLAGLLAKPVELTTGDDAALVSGDVVLSLVDRKKLHPDPPLVGTTWVANAVGTMQGDAGGVNSLEKGVVGYLTFAEDGTVDVYDGCNSGNANATVEGNEITFGDFLHTDRGCLGTSVQELQKAFSDVLRGKATYVIDEQNLQIINGSRSLYFRAAAKPPTHD